MGETHPAGLAGNVGDNALPGGFVENHEELIATDATHPLECGEVELASERGGQDEDESAVGGKMLQPAPDHHSYTFRKHSAPAFSVRKRRQRFLTRKQPQCLSDEEGVAFRRTMERADEVPRRLETGRQ